MLVIQNIVISYSVVQSSSNEMYRSMVETSSLKIKGQYVLSWQAGLVGLPSLLVAIAECITVRLAVLTYRPLSSCFSTYKIPIEAAAGSF